MVIQKQSTFEQRNKKILDGEKVTHRPLIDILKTIDQDFLKE